MSNYLPGLVDYVPIIQPYKADLNSYAQMLQLKEAQYQAGYDKISSLYGTLLDSPMLRTDNKEIRNKFFVDISNQIRQISGLDLSQSQNIEAAAKVFQPLLDDDYIMKDMTYTKQAMKELSKAESYKNCTDPKKCGDKYWQGGVRAIHYQMDDFSKMRREDTIKQQAPSYTPKVNLPKQALEFAKEMGFNMQNISFSPDGRYKITTKNGEAMVPYLNDVFAAAFGNDSAAQEYYKTVSYLDRKTWAEEHADEHGSVEAAEYVYLDQLSKSIAAANAAEQQRIDKSITDANNNQAVAESIIKSKGVDPNNKNDQKLIAQRNQAIVDALILQQNKSQKEEVAQNLDPESLTDLDIAAKRMRVDAAVANAKFSQDLFAAADNYAMLTKEETIDEDQYALKQYDHSLQMAKVAVEQKNRLELERVQQKNRIELEDRRASNDILIDDYKNGNSSKKGKKTPELESDDPDSNVPKVTANAPGNIAEVENLMEVDEKHFYSQAENNTESLKNYANVVLSRLNTILSANNGTYLEGTEILIDDTLKKWAKEKRESIFGTVEEVNEQVLDDQYTFGNKPWYQAFANNFLSEENEYQPQYKTVTKYKGGYLDKSGKLIDFSKVEDFASNSDNNWFGLAQKLKSANSDAAYAQVFDGDKSLKAAEDDYSRSENNYFNYLEILKKNKTSSGNIAISSMVEVGSEDLPINTRIGVNDKYVLSMVGKIQDPNTGNMQSFGEWYWNVVTPELSQKMKDFRGKDVIDSEKAFVARFGENSTVTSVSSYLTDEDIERIYRGEQKNLEKENRGDSTKRMAIQSYARYFDEHKDYFESVYEKYLEQYGKQYNRQTGSKENMDYVSLPYGSSNITSGGNLEAQSYSYANIDAAYAGDQGAKDSRDLISKWMELHRSGASSLEFYEGSGRDGEDKNDLMSTGRGLDVAELILSQLKSGVKTDDDKRMVWDLSIHNMVNGDPNLVGFTINPHSSSVSANKGSKQKEGALSKEDTPEAMTFVMSRADASTVDAYERLARGPMALEERARGSVTIDAYDKGGNLVIKKSPTGGWQANGVLYDMIPTYNEKGQITGVQQVPITYTNSSYGNIDDFGKMLSELLKEQYGRNYEQEQILKQNNVNIVYDPNFGKPQ